METTTETLPLTPDATLQEIINFNPFAEDLLTTIGVDTEALSDKTLRQLCVQKQWSEYEVLDWIVTFRPDAKLEEQTTDREIVAVSRLLLNDSIPRIETLANDILRDLQRVHDLHGNQVTWLKSAVWYINKLIDRQTSWWSFEKESLYPQLTHLTDPSADLNRDELEQSLSVLDEKHRQTRHLIRKIRSVSNDLTVNEFACATFHILVGNLRHYFDALTTHIRIEREDLIPQVRKRLQS